jgi:hypothetical protein
VRDDDLDWEIYHAITDGGARTVGDLEAAGYDPSLVEVSLCRLERAFLVERKGDSVRVLSFQESLLLCQARHEEGCPFVIENGIIKARSVQERKP